MLAIRTQTKRKIFMSKIIHSPHKKKEVLSTSLSCSCPYMLSSRYLGWDGIIAEYHKQPALKIDRHCQLYHVIEINFCPQIEILRCWNRSCSLQNLRLGNINIIPARISTEVSWKQKYEYLSLYLQPTYLAEIASELINATSVEIVPQFAICDPTIYHLALLFKSELESTQISNRLYIESLTNTLAINLLRRYAVQKQLPQNYSDGLSKSKLQQIVNYIEAHLNRDLSLKTMAAILHISPHYFSDLFKQSMGISAYQYVVKRRIETAKRLLKQPDLPIIEIAHCTGFKTSSHFSNTFRKHIGVTPSAYRRKIE